jgi:carboxymethylenebutenolidase
MAAHDGEDPAMTTTARNSTIPSDDGGAIPAYIAMPATLPAPAVVIVAAVFGVDAGTREWADRYAARGFIAIAPDFFWRTIPGPLRAEIPAERAQATERNQKFDRDAGQRDIGSVRDYVRALPESNGKWAVAGYCFGGRYTLLAGAYLGADAVAGFHPSKMGLELEAAAKVSCPVSYHFGGADESVPMDVVEAVQAALKDNPHAESFVYPGVAHGFTMKTRPAYDPAVAELSFERALTVLDKLKTAAPKEGMIGA